MRVVLSDVSIHSPDGQLPERVKSGEGEADGEERFLNKANVAT